MSSFQKCALTMSTYCTFCDKFFSSMFNLKRHCQTKHPKMDKEEKSVIDEEEMSNGESGSIKSNNHDDESDSNTEDENENSDDTSDDENGGFNSIDETRLFNIHDKRVVQFCETMAPMCDLTPASFYKKLILFYYDVKKSKCYHAIKSSAQNLLLEHDLMTSKESLLLSFKNRKYLLDQLFGDLDSQ